jgi:hypothetical protein
MLHPDVREALERFVRARDFNAEHGYYPPEYEIVCYDDWVADISQTLLDNQGK